MLKLQHKISDYILIPCVCYLPPENSSRSFDVDSFYDHLLSCICEYQNCGNIYICGDFNSRCGDLDDFIVGVDVVPERKVVDYTTNSYGERFIDFLINTNMCMLNGRSDSEQNYTSVSINGSSVVDYCIVPHEQLFNFTNFSVNLTSDLITSCRNIANLVPSSTPDHSLLAWNIVTGLNHTVLPDKGSNEIPQDGHVKFDLNSIPSNFLSDQAVLEEINVLINKLETLENDSLNIDNVYKEWCNIVKVNMYDNIPYKRVNVNVTSSFRKHKPGKP